jgi:hypothetical protein
MMPDDQPRRDAITAAFKHYKGLVTTSIMPRFGAQEHWAKLELPMDHQALPAAREKLARRYPTAAFIKARREMDPKGVLANDWVEGFFPTASE